MRMSLFKCHNELRLEEGGGESYYHLIGYGEKGETCAINGAAPRVDDYVDSSM